MSLRVQLLGLGLLTLVLPWAAYRYVQELEGALRDGLEQALLASADTIATALRESALSVFDSMQENTPATTIYAHPLTAAPDLDGYQNDWNLAEGSERALGSSGRYWAGIHERSLYLFISVDDASRVYQSAPTELPYGDRAVLLPSGTGNDWLLLHTTAPGVLRPQLTSAPEFTPSGHFENRGLAYWRETDRGYAVEIRLPLDLVGARLGLALIDVDPATDGSEPSTGSDYSVTMVRSWPADALAPERLIYRPAAVDLQSRRFEQAGKRLRVVDRDGWVMFDGGAIDPLEQFFSRNESIGLLERILGLILAHGDPAYAELEQPPGYMGDSALRAAMSGTGGVAWYARGTAASAVVVAVAPIYNDTGNIGAVVLEQGSDSILTLTNDALVELMSFALVASLLVALGLLSYATYLSIRVRRLARAADTAMGPKGEIDPKLPGRDARDEIGDLARSFTALLGKLRDHTQYLTTLQGKLAHELRTPLAVVTTSLDNLDREPHDASSAPYLARVREGADRLDSILATMSEATALEQAVTAMSREQFELAAVVRGCVEGYRDLYRDRELTFSSDAGSSEMLGSPELIAQMLDKLIDNAVSFSVSESAIAVTLSTSGEDLKLSISNEGPRLPAAMRASLFDSLVSVRAEGNHRGHLGLGLYVVALIVEFHGGKADAEDLPDGSGVVFTVSLPRAS